MNKQRAITPEWLRVKEAMSYTGLGRTTLWKIYNSDSGVVTAKVGSCVLISRTSLDQYLRSCSVVPNRP